MNAKSLTLGALRVLSVYVLVEGISAIPFLWTSGSSTIDLAPALISALGISTVLLPAASGIILWFISPLLARTISDEGRGESGTDTFTESAAQRIVFVTLGIYLIVITIPVLFVRLGEWVLSLDKAASLMPNDIAFLISAFVRVLLGVVLIIGAQSFTGLIQRMREFGLPAARDE